MATPRGNLYIIFLDDYSRYSVIYLLTNKPDASEKIREYFRVIKNQFDRYPKYIRSDGGGEYIDSALKFFFRGKKYSSSSAPYLPQ